VDVNVLVSTLSSVLQNANFELHRRLELALRPLIREKQRTLYDVLIAKAWDERSMVRACVCVCEFVSLCVFVCRRVSCLH
jgi:hypothetical protein